ncbi:MAG: Fe-S cluster assembly protein SufD [Alphaproteobacteria bacterium]|nr:Fe-S cluster assembly protein SufD [Alphaproteobacteria bacterium]
MSVANHDALVDVIAGSAAAPLATPWLAARQQAALAGFRASGVPHRRVEDWKYSDLRTALQDSGTTIEAPQAANIFAGLTGCTLDLCDGHLVTALDALPHGVEAVNLADGVVPGWVSENLGKTSRNGMADASLALMTGGLALRVKSGVVVEKPLCLNINSGTAHHVRLLLVVEDGAGLTLLEHHAHAASLANIGFEIVLGAKSALTHVRVAQSARDAVQVEEVAVTQGAGSSYRGHYADLGARLSRLELQVGLEGADAVTDLSGVHVLHGGRHADVTTRMDHNAGHTESTQLFKHIVAGVSRAVYQGRITVGEGANGTDSRQTAKALLLDERSEADLKPELIIFADDVKCAHGAAVGDLDVDSLFYLRSRGIPEDEARGLLMRAFVEDAVSGIANDDIRTAVWAMVERALLDVGVAA